MPGDSLKTLNGIHKLYRRLLKQAPNDIAKAIDPKNVQAYFKFHNAELVAEINLEEKKISLPIASLDRFSDFYWIPHISLTDQNEIFAVTEMIKEFNEMPHKEQLTELNRGTLLITMCNAFFREVYR